MWGSEASKNRGTKTPRAWHDPCRADTPVRRLPTHCHPEEAQAFARVAKPFAHFAKAGSPRRASSSVGLQHLLGMLARSLGQLSPTEHAGDFFGALFSGDEADGGASAVARAFFLDKVMMVGEGCDLGKMSYAEHLIGSRQCLQLFAHGLSRASTDAGIDFVEYQSALRARFPFALSSLHAGLEREHHPGKFAAGGDVLQPSQRL